MRIELTKTSHILFFVVLLPLVSWEIGWFFSQMFPDLPFWMEGISPLGAYGLLIAFFNAVAWHWPVFRWLGICALPDLRGRWIGEQQSSYRTSDGKNVTSHVVLEIKQTFSDVSARTFYKNWDNMRCDANFLRLDGQDYLVILFQSAPNSNHTGHGTIHQGVTRLKYSHDNRQLTGSYFNSNGNYGEIIYTHQGKRLFGRFTK